MSLRLLLELDLAGPVHIQLCNELLDFYYALRLDIGSILRFSIKQVERILRIFLVLISTKKL